MTCDIKYFMDALYLANTLFSVQGCPFSAALFWYKREMFQAAYHWSELACMTGRFVNATSHSRLVVRSFYIHLVPSACSLFKMSAWSSQRSNERNLQKLSKVLQS